MTRFAYLTQAVLASTRGVSPTQILECLDCVTMAPPSCLPDERSLSLFVTDFINYFFNRNEHLRLNHPRAAKYVTKWRARWMAGPAPVLLTDPPELDLAAADARRPACLLFDQHRAVGAGGLGFGLLPTAAAACVGQTPEHVFAACGVDPRDFLPRLQAAMSQKTCCHVAYVNERQWFASFQPALAGGEVVGATVLMLPVRRPSALESLSPQGN